MKVLLINRKPRQTGNFSIESYFRSVYSQLRDRIDCSYFVSSWESKGLLPRVKAVREVQKLRADVYHITGDVHFLTLGTPPARTVLTIHDCGFMKGKPFHKKFFLWLFWIWLPVLRSRFVTTVSEATRKEVLHYTRCRPEKIQVIHTTVSEDFTRRDKTFNEKLPVILHIGTKPNKNLPRLIRAAAGIECTLLIIGELSSTDLELLARYNTSYRNYSNVSDEELRGYYATADIIFFASTLEGFGMPIVEGQITGRPVITSDCSSMPEVAGDGALLVDPLDVNAIRRGILKLLGDSELRTDIVEKGFVNAGRFNTRTVAEQYTALYRKVL